MAVAVSISELRRNLIDYLDYVWETKEEVLIINAKRREIVAKMVRFKEDKNSRFFKVQKA